MSNPKCNDGKSSPNPCNPVFEKYIQDLDLVGWFKKLNADDKEELIRELSTKVQGNISIEKLPSDEREEDLKSRHFQELLQKLSSNSKKNVGSKILKAYLRVHRRSPNMCKKNKLHSLDIEHEEQHLFKIDQQFIKLKSIDSRQGISPVLQKQGAISEVGFLLNPELFKIKTLKIRRPQGEQDAADQLNNSDHNRLTKVNARSSVQLVQ